MPDVATTPTVSSYTPPAARSATAAPKERVTALDIVRGLAMVLMAIDHTRVYAGVPAGGPAPAVFFTRWITHFVAPTFVFLAGTAAYLHGDRLRDRAKLSRFLLARGAWLVLLELTVLRLAWTFNFDYAHYVLAGVIWMIGLCMIAMAGLVRLPLAAVATFGVATIALHDVMDFVPVDGPSGPLAWLWQVLYFGGPIALGTSKLAVLFVVVPWVGVMAAGYAFGRVMQMEPARRRVICLRLGLGAIAAFLVLRTLDVYGDPNHWRGGGRMPAPLRFLATNKYPASLLFLLMTLGPMLVAILPFAERMRGAVARVLAVFGRVPLFYYLLHIPLIHALALLVSLVRTPAQTWWLFANHPMMPPPAPPGYRWSLPLLYVVFAVAVTILYFPCRWFADVKARRRGGWLSYL